MKIAAYVTIRSDYFLFHVQEMMKTGQSVSVIPLHEWLLNATEPPSEISWRKTLETFFDTVEPDVVLAYNRPDEVTMELCRRRQLPVCCQERFGNHPGKMPMLFPSTVDLKRVAEQMNIDDEWLRSGTGAGKLLEITLAFSLSCFTVAESIPEVVRWMKSGKAIVPLATYWRESSMLDSHMNLLRFVLEAIDAADVDCRLNVRVHPAYRDRYASETGWVSRQDRRDIVLDDRSIDSCLQESDVLICSTSNIGADALRAGCRVVSVEERAFYAHQQLTDSCSTVDELIRILEQVDTERMDGRRLQAPLCALLRLGESVLKTSCSPSCPADTRALVRALHAALALPQITTRDSETS